MHKIVYLIADESEMQYNHLGWKLFISLLCSQVNKLNPYWKGNVTFPVKSRK